MVMKVSEIFIEEPCQWGLRGDRFLWRELKECFKSVDMPSTPIALKKLIEAQYKISTGYSISHKENFMVDRFRHGGMSSGYISPNFWGSRGIPLLVGRHVTP